jgi:hypothetical protein
LNFDHSKPSSEYSNCKLALRVLENRNSENWVLGLPFLQQYFSIFDLRNHRIGLINTNVQPGYPIVATMIPEPEFGETLDIEVLGNSEF